MNDDTNVKWSMPSFTTILLFTHVYSIFTMRMAELKYFSTFNFVNEVRLPEGLVVATSKKEKKKLFLIFIVFLLCSLFIRT